jgi:hypothetical protein
MWGMQNPRLLHFVISKGACKIGCPPSASWCLPSQIVVTLSFSLFFSGKSFGQNCIICKVPQTGSTELPSFGKTGDKNEKSGWKQYTGIKKHGTKLGFSLKLVHPPILDLPYLCFDCFSYSSLYEGSSQNKILQTFLTDTQFHETIPNFTHFVPIHSNWEWNRV